MGALGHGVGNDAVETQGARTADEGEGSHQPYGKPEQQLGLSSLDVIRESLRHRESDRRAAIRPGYRRRVRIGFGVNE
jgi:hypothetical protein